MCDWNFLNLIKTLGSSQVITGSGTLRFNTHFMRKFQSRVLILPLRLISKNVLAHEPGLAFAVPTHDAGISAYQSDSRFTRNPVRTIL